LREDFVLEIGSEDLPSRYVDLAIDQLRETFRKFFESHRIDYDELHTFGTPRRLVLFVEGLASKQRTVEEQIIGPPAKAAIDNEGKFTKAAEGFARSQGVEVKSLHIVDTPRGDYMAVTKKVRGRPTQSLLKEELAELIGSIKFPKMMKWDNSHLKWARPIRWVLCMLGRKSLRFRMGNIVAGSKTKLDPYGRSMVGVKGPEDYFAIIEKAGIILDSAERKRSVKRMAEKAAARSGGRLVEDDELVGIVANMLERPVVVRGSYDEEFLKLPREVIVTALKSHQKYFSVEQKRGFGLLPLFVAFADGSKKNISGIKKGFERVLQARLDDAVFYFNEDTAQPLEELAQKLDSIVWLEGLGTLRQKAKRMEKLALWMMQAWGVGGGDIEGKTRKAALLAKADLASEMVKDGKEFTLLQGYIGREYALVSGEDREIADAIFEHYLPRFAEDDLPKGIIGVLLALADKLDSIAGCFALGLEPTGSQDPYALRRQSLGVLRIMLERELRISLRSMVGEAVRLVLDDIESSRVDMDPGKLENAVFDFLNQRFNVMLKSEGYDYDLVLSALSAPWETPVSVLELVKELQSIREEGHLEEIVLPIKRIVNILPAPYKEGYSRDKGLASLKAFSSHDTEKLGISVEIFTDEAERRLFNKLSRFSSKMAEIYEKNEPKGIIEVIKRLKNSIDKYFDKVLVNCEDEKVRENRLSFLARFFEMVSLFCDFSKIAGE